MSAPMIRSAAIAGCVAILAACACAQSEEGAPVRLEGQTLFRIRARLGPFSADDRARAVSSRLLTLSKDRDISTDEITLVTANDGIDIVARDQVLATVSNEDARLARTPRNALAA